MRILDFDIKKGIYHFQLEALETERHAHPVVEIIRAKQGCFSLESPDLKLKDLDFVLIDSNTEHQINLAHGEIEILMIESHNRILTSFLQKKGIAVQNGIFFGSEFTDQALLFSEIKNLAQTMDLKRTTDERVNECLTFISENEVEYKELLPLLSSKVFLSNSRLSHLFKEHIGISLKRYMVWNRLRQAIHHYLNGQENLNSVSLQSGFFDLAHLSHAFKSNFGISPSVAYNSRTLQ